MGFPGGQVERLQSTVVPTPNTVEKRAKGTDAVKSDIEELKLWSQHWVRIFQCFNFFIYIKGIM